MTARVGLILFDDQSCIPNIMLIASAAFFLFGSQCCTIIMLMLKFDIDVVLKLFDS